MAEDTCVLLPGLPQELALLCFSKLPIDAVARCRAVSRSWASALLEHPGASRLPQAFACLCVGSVNISRKTKMNWLLLSRSDLRCRIIPFFIVERAHTESGHIYSCSHMQVLRTGKNLLIVWSMLSFSADGSNLFRAHKDPGLLQALDLWYKENKKHELKMPKSLEGVNGVPTEVNELSSSDDALFIRPVGESLTRGMRVSRAHQAVFSSIVDIIREAHKRGIVHRDVRHSNILLVGEPDGGSVEVMMIDWGFAIQAGVTRSFAESVVTGSDRVLEQLKSLERTRGKIFSFSPSGEGTADASSEGKRSWTTAEDEVPLGDLNSMSRITRAKATAKADVSLGDLSIGSRISMVGSKMAASSSITKTESALPSEAARRSDCEDSRRSDCEKPYEYSFYPSDDLVSLVRTLMMFHFREIEGGLRLINKHDYEGYLKFWAKQMLIRPEWHKAQKYAENCQYDDLKNWINDYARNFMP